ncbi:hypothetical protein LPJ64_002301 [Coemansia asiatica]|uniref:Uncharacterized protein n=1 Tax=Coemansia asiatica TaxID=1052880 RepID=A0A9W7XNC7_9FUNG|nr:hypothetical protein LPJ64_002301 [Coemansia asiatica]
MGTANGLLSRHSAEKGLAAELFISQAAQSIKSELALPGLDRVDLPGDSDPAIDEDDSWLMLEPDELDALMRKAEALVKEAAQDEGSHNAVPVGDSESSKAIDSIGQGENEAAMGLHGMLESFESFLAVSSGVDGAEMLNDFQDEEYGEDSDEDIDLDADGVLRALMETIGIRELSELDRAFEARKDVTENGEKALKSLSSVAPTSASASAPAPAPVSEPLTKTASADTGSETADTEADETVMAQIMDAMDHELSATSIGKSFVRYGPEADSDASDSDNSGDGHETMPDVNVDLNLVENIVRSFRAQEGLPGPAGTMLGQFYVCLPPDESENDENDNGNSDNW